MTGVEAKSPPFMEAKAQELASWAEMGVTEVVDLTPQISRSLITGRWVLVWKELEDGTRKAKARFVARGFQDPEASVIAKEAPTASKVCWRSCVAIAVLFGWSPFTIDIKTAFLHASLPRPVYLRPPSEAKVPKGKVWRLLRAVYGLVDSPREWYKALVEV